MEDNGYALELAAAIQTGMATNRFSTTSKVRLIEASSPDSIYYIFLTRYQLMKGSLMRRICQRNLRYEYTYSRCVFETSFVLTAYS
jgi:hypothetical protein